MDEARTVGWRWRWRNICATKVGAFAKEKVGFGASVSEEEAMILKV